MLLASNASSMTTRENVLIKVFELFTTDCTNYMVWTRLRFFDVSRTLFFRSQLGFLLGKVIHILSV